MPRWGACRSSKSVEGGWEEGEGPGTAPAHPITSPLSSRYVDTLADVAAFASCLHLLPTPPSAVCVDDLPSLPPGGPRADRRAVDAALARALALLADGTSGAWYESEGGGEGAA